MPTEIVQVIQEFSSDGGAENVSWELARAFARAGIPNRVITNRVGGVVEPGITIEVVAPWLTRIPTRGLLRHIGRFVVVPAFSFAATVALRRHPQAVVITHGDSLGGDILVVHAVNAASLASKRADGLWHWMLNPIHLWVALRDRWMISGLRYRRFVAVSRRVLSELHDYHRVPEDRIRIIPNGIDLARFTPDPEARRAVRAEFGIAEDTKLMLFVGHEFSRKGLAHAIGALKQLGPEYRLMVVGSENPGPYRDLAGARRDDVIFAGARSDVPIFFAASDALVLPTSYETFSLVCMEAMATGVPVFATAVGGIEDYLVDGVNGWVIQAEAGDIAATIHRALSDPEQAATLREGALETARRYGWPMISRQYIALVDEIAQAKKAGRGLPQAV